MKVEVNFNRKTLFIMLAIAIVIGGLFVVTATKPNPGHDASEIGSGVFSGTATDKWGFLGDVGIGTSDPQRKLHVVTNDRILIQGTDSNGADAPSIALREGASGSRWDIIKRGSTWTASQEGIGTSNDLLFVFHPGGASPSGNKNVIILDENGQVYMPLLSGSGNYLCIGSDGRLTRAQSC